MSQKPLALITGGTSGIGFGIAEKLAASCDLAIIFRNDEVRAQHAAESLSNNSTVRIYKQDLSILDEIPALVAKITSDFGRSPLVLVNSAGQLRDGLFQGSKISDHQALITEHLLSPMALCQVCIRGMSSAKFGRIINLSSISAHFAKRGQTNYSAAKGAIESFTRTLALEVAHRGVTVNAIAPGLIETPMTKALVEKIQSSGENIRSRIPAGRLGQASDVGSLAAFLASAEASYITGVTITIDGGRSLGDPNS